MITHEQLEMWFTYHAPTMQQKVQYEEIRVAAKQFASVIVRNTPSGADQTAALRKIREATMTANQAIACQEETRNAETERIV